MSVKSWPVKAQVALKPKTKESATVALIYAGVLLILVVFQLFSFQDFPSVVTSYWLPGGQQFAHFLAAFIVAAEVFALPFLLRMKLSIGMRFFSMFLGWLVAAIWIYISFWLMFTVNSVQNAGFLGSTVSITPGWWMVFISLAFAILAIWASWGLWPLKTAKTSSDKK